MREVLLPRTDAGVLVQVFSLLVLMAVSIVLVRRERSLVTLALGVGIFVLGSLHLARHRQVRRRHLSDRAMFTMWVVPAPGLTAPLTAVVEIVAGIMLLVGLGTRIAAMALSVVMIGALIYVKQDLGIISGQPMPGAELDLARLAGLVAVIVLGPGRLSLDHQVGIEPPRVIRVPRTRLRLTRP